MKPKTVAQKIRKSWGTRWANAGQWMAGVARLWTWVAKFAAKRAGGTFTPGDHMIVPKGRATFDRKEADAIGFNEAIILEELRSWIAWNERNGKRASHCNEEGDWWLYNSPREWQQKHFPWWSESTIRRSLEKLLAADLVTCAPYEKGSSRRWWAVGKVQGAPPNRKNQRQYELPGMQSDTAASQNDRRVFQNDRHTGSESLQDSFTPREGINRQEQQADAHAPTSARVPDGGVAAFRNAAKPGTLPEPKSALEAADGVEREHQPLPGGSAMATQAPPPVPPAPSPALVWMRGFWTECTDAELETMLQRWGETRLLAEQQYAKGKRNPAGFARDRLQKNLQPPPAIAAPVEPTQTSQSEIDTTPDVKLDEDDETQADHARLAAIGPVAVQHWADALVQLELQLGRAGFDTWLRGAKLLAVDGNVFRVGVRNEQVRYMLQKQLYRDVQRMLGHATESKAVEIQFEVMGRKVEAVA